MCRVDHHDATTLRRDQFLALNIGVAAIVAGLSALAMIAGLLIGLYVVFVGETPHRRLQRGGTMD